MEQESTGLKMFQHRKQSKSCPQRAAGRQGLRGGGGGGMGREEGRVGGEESYDKRNRKQGNWNYPNGNKIYTENQ